jgi:hypothetical protein
VIKHIGEKWRDLRKVANNWALAMDYDPLEDVRRRVRRLEAAGSQSSKDCREERGQTRASPADPAETG